MLELERLNPDNSTDSPYAHELRAGVPRLRFAAPLEGLYQQAHLQRMRLRVRLWFSFAAMVAIADIVIRLLGYDRHDPIVWAYGLADGCCLALAWLAWAPLYGRFYQPAARLLVPLLGAASAVFIARALVIGQGQQLAVLTMTIFVFFLFSGLLFRSALFATVLLVVTFAVALPSFGPFNLSGAASLAVLVVTATICLIGYLDIERSYRRSFLEKALISELVGRDELSGLMNRRAFYEQMQRVWQQAQRERRALAVLMIDIDHFKSYNDTLGHQAGDTALRSVAQLLKGLARRPLDLAARYGGDEFVAVLYDLPVAQVQEIAERMRQAVEDSPQPHAAAPQAADTVASVDPAGCVLQNQAASNAVTVSIGVGLMVPTHGRSFQGAVQLADEALYEAKQAGRNRAVLKGDEDYRRLSTGSFRQPRQQAEQARTS